MLVILSTAITSNKSIISRLRISYIIYHHLKHSLDYAAFHSCGIFSNSVYLLKHIYEFITNDIKIIHELIHKTKTNKFELKLCNGLNYFFLV